MDTRLYVCTHKIFNVPEDSLYHPLHVGRAISNDLGYEGDDTGENISRKNKSYCELTGMYWIWKNVDCDIVGIVHYRRFFEHDGELLDQAYIEKLLCEDGYDVIIPVCSFSDYKDNRTHYAKAHFLRDYEIAREVILEKYPEYVDAFDLYGNTSISTLANMVITRKKIYDEYCQWLFDVLDEVENRTDVSDYSPYQARLYGYLSERLFQIWLLMHRYRIHEEQVRILLGEGDQGRLVLFKGAQDTLDIFISDLYESLGTIGYECLLFDMKTIPQGLAALSAFMQKPVKAAIGFNSLGFNMEIISGQNIWNSLGIPFINILVDNPLCHDKELSNAPGTAIVLTANIDHMNCINRYYPGISTTGFLPLAGRAECKAPKDIKDRKIDVIYMEDSSISLEGVLETIARAGINLSVYGDGWDGYDWINLPNVDYHQRIAAAETYALMEEAKVVLSTMTSINAGINDRIYSGMLCGACVVSDISQYIIDNFKCYPDKEAKDAELVMFELYETNKLLQIIKSLLLDNALMQMIADNGRRHALVTETWSARASELHSDLLTKL